MTNLDKLLKKATPLPWFQPTGSGDIAMLKDENGITIVRCLQRGSETPHPEANAALIAHALKILPEVVTALETILKNPIAYPTETVRALLEKVNNPKGMK